MDNLLTMSNQDACPEFGRNLTTEEHFGALVEKLRPDSGELSVKSVDASGYSCLALQLCELVDVAAKMAKLDGLCAQAAESAPVSNAEAKKWQEISMNAMHLSREALVEQQKRCVQKLAEFSVASCPTPLPNCKVGHAPTAKTVVASCPQRSQMHQKSTSPPSTAAVVAKKPEQERGWNGTLRTHLSTLQNEDPMCVLIVRRINRLGFDSDEALKEYFKELGGVRHVLVAHSRVKPNAKRPVARVRPAGIGFVVMGSQEETNEILAMQEHVIRNVSVQVHRYETRFPLDEEEVFEPCNET